MRVVAMLVDIHVKNQVHRVPQSDAARTTTIDDTDSSSGSFNPIVNIHAA